MQCSLKFNWLSIVALRVLGLRVVGGLVPSTITFGYKLNSFVHVEKIDFVNLSFNNERFLPVSQVLRLFRSGSMFAAKVSILGPGVVRIVSSA